MPESSGLERSGWARYGRAEIIGDADPAALAPSLARLRASFARLPPDRYDPASRRYRRHARAVYVPWTRTLSWVPSVEDPEHGPVIDYAVENAEFAGVSRQFPAIPPDVLEDPLLARIIRFDLEQTTWLEGFRSLPWHVGVDCIRLSVPEPGDEAAATPNALHQDGGALSIGFVHLVVRQNVVGGANYISSPRCVGFLPSEVSPALIDAEFTLEEPLDSFAVHDSRVSHHVSPVRRGEQPCAGERGVLLVGVAPLVRQR